MAVELSTLLAALIGRVIVADLESPFVCLGTLAGIDGEFLLITDADLHDFRDSTATRETYVYDSARLGVRRNRARVLLKRSQIVALTALADVAES